MAINPNTEPGGHVRTVHPFNFQVGIEKAILDSNFWACLIVGVYKLYSRVYHTCSVGYVQNIFLFVPSQVLSSPFCSLSLLLIVVTQIRGHIAGPSPPLPSTVRALHFYRVKISALCTLLDSRRIMRGFHLQ